MNKFKDNKQFFFSEDDDFLILRRESFNFVKKFMKKCKSGTKLLEIGPSTNEDSYPEYDVSSYVSNYCKNNNIIYKTCNIVGECDYQCDVTFLSNFVNEKFDYILANSVLEHVVNFWNVPVEFFKVLKDNGKVLVITPFLFKIHGPDPDCFRISPIGYKYLFNPYFKELNIETYPENQIGKNSFPLLVKFEGLADK